MLYVPSGTGFVSINLLKTVLLGMIINQVWCQKGLISESHSVLYVVPLCSLEQITYSLLTS